MDCMCSVNLLWPTIYMFFYSIYMSSFRHAFVFGSFQLCVYGSVLEDFCFSIQNQNLNPLSLSLMEVAFDL